MNRFRRRRGGVEACAAPVRVPHPAGSRYGLLQLLPGAGDFRVLEQAAWPFEHG